MKIDPPQFRSPVTEDLDARGIPYRTFTHPAPVVSLEQAALERGQNPGQVVRSIVFRLPDDEFVMVLVPGPEQISWPRLRERLGVSRMTMASKEEVFEHTGYQTGGYPPSAFHRLCAFWWMRRSSISKRSRSVRACATPP